MKKITQKVLKEFLKYKLSTDKRWAEKTLIRIYEKQTKLEKLFQHTSELNNVGFTAYDSFLLTAIVKNIIKKRKDIPTYQLSNMQFNKIIFKKIPKYWKQIYNICNKEKLKNCYIKHLQTKGLQLTMGV